jgi:hypothetical protein
MCNIRAKKRHATYTYGTHSMLSDDAEECRVCFRSSEKDFLALVAARSHAISVQLFNIFLSSEVSIPMVAPQPRASPRKWAI